MGTITHITYGISSILMWLVIIYFLIIGFPVIWSILTNKIAVYALIALVIIVKLK